MNLTTMLNSLLHKRAALHPMSSKEKKIIDKPWITSGILTSIKTKK